MCIKKLALCLSMSLMLSQAACSSDDELTEEVVQDSGTMSDEPATPPEDSNDLDLGDSQGQMDVTDLSSDASTTGSDDVASDATDFSIESFVMYFDYDDDTVKSVYQTELQQLADYLNQGERTLTIEGHCDERGSVEYNLALGQRRAESVKDYLVTLGVSASKIDTLSFGEEKPLVFESNESAYAKNRRAQFTR